MESHYKDSLSTAIVNILLQCGFENSSKRALDEFVGLSLNNIRNISSKVSRLTNECGLHEPDIMIGLGALKLHGDNLDELFNFLQNYNEIFPPQPKIYFGPVPLTPVTKSREEKPLGIVSWAPEMSPALATIGMRIKNNQIVSDPNFDRSKFLSLSFKSPTRSNDSKSANNSMSQSQTSINSAVKYGSSCSYQLPPEAYPNKYEAPTVDLDSNGAVIGLNGKTGKLPDPYINDLEEQDILRQKSKFNEKHSTKMTFHNQLFNGVRQKQRSSNTIHDSPKNSPQIQKKIRPECSPVSEHYTTNHVDKTVTSDDAWNAALQATVTTIIKPEPYIMTIDNSPTHVIKKHKKRHRSPSETRIKKIRRVDDRIENDVCQIYQNESTMDSRFSDAVPYSLSPDRQSTGYNYNNSYQSNQMKEKSPSYSPINNAVPISKPRHPGSQFSYSSEIIPSQSFLSASKSKKKKSTRKTHFTNKRKKKPLQPTPAVNYNFLYPMDNAEIIDNDNVSIGHDYNPRSHTPSPIDTYVDDSDDDGTEPMKESSEEMLKMLEIADSNHNQIMDMVVDSPPYPSLNNKHDHVPDTPSEGGIRMKIKLFKTNSVTNRAGSYITSVTDLSSAPASQHSDDKNSILERLKQMRDDSPLSPDDRRPYEHSAFDKSPLLAHHSQYSARERDSPSVSSTQGSYMDFYKPVNSVVSANMSQSNTPQKYTVKSVDLLRHNSASSHSSPKTLPALDDCDSKIPSLLFKSTKSSKKRKRSRISSSTKKTKSKKSSRQKLENDLPTPKIPEKPFISVDDVFSDDEDHQQKSVPVSVVIAQSYHNDQPMHQTPLIIDKVVSPPYRLPIPVIKINNKSLSKKSSSSSKSIKHKHSATPVMVIKEPEPKNLYNYSCLQGEAHYESEDGKMVYICPICNTEDNGSLMLQCDSCQDWYHGLCLGIFDAPPEHLEWFCPRCIEDRLSLSQQHTNSLTRHNKPIKSRTKKK